MSNQNKLIPELRFPEFVKDGEWKREVLGNLLNFQTGFPFDSQGFNENEIGVRLIKNKDLKSEGKKVFYNKPFDEKYLVNDGDVLIGMDGDFTPSVWQKGKALLNQRVGRIIANVKEQEIFYFYFLSIHLKTIEEKTARTTVKHLSHTDVEKIYEPLPKPTEQQKIASCLSSLDEVITAHTDKLETLKTYKKGLMQNLFPQEGEKVPKFRFKEFEKDGEWKKKSFDKLFEIGNGRDYKHLNKGEVPVYGTGGYMLSVDEYLYNGESACIGRKGTIDKPMFLEGKFWTVDTLFYTHSFNNCIPKFIFYIFQNIDWKKHNEAGGVPSLSKANIYKIEVFSPNPKEQQKIVDLLSSLDNLIQEQSNKIEQLKSHKRGLMQGLFPKMKN